MKRSVSLYLKDIETAVKKIEKYTKDLSYKDYKNNEVVQDAVIRNLEIIGEAAKNIPKEIRNKHGYISWKEIIGMRNKVIHEYFGVDLEILWETVEEDIPELKKRIARFKRGLTNI